jgi:uncharacterized protein
MAAEVGPRVLRWRLCDGVGLEHASVMPENGGFRVTSVVIGEHEGVAYGARYELLCDESWRTRLLAVECLDGRALRLESDGAGRWTDAAGKPLPRLDGCIDIDLSASPLTNTLPVRRCGIDPAAGAMRFRMALVPFDTLEPFPDEQIYTALDDRGRFHFAAADGSFEAEILMDEDRFVVSYPPLYERV